MFSRMAGLGGRASSRRMRSMYQAASRMNGTQRRQFTLALTDHHSRLSWNDAIFFACLAYGGAVSLSFALLHNMSSRMDPADVDDKFYELWKVMRDPAKRLAFERAHRLEIAAPGFTDTLGEYNVEDGKVIYLFPQPEGQEDVDTLRSRRTVDSFESVRGALSTSNEKTILAAAGVDNGLLAKAQSDISSLNREQKDRLTRGVTAVLLARQLAGAGVKRAYSGPAFSAFREQTKDIRRDLGNGLKLGSLARQLGVQIKDTDKAMADIQKNEQLSAAVNSVVPTLKAKYELLAPGKDELGAYKQYWQNYKKAIQGGVVSVVGKNGTSIPTFHEGGDESGLNTYVQQVLVPKANDPFYAVGLSVFAPEVNAAVAQQAARAENLFSRLAAKQLGPQYDTTPSVLSPLA